MKKMISTAAFALMFGCGANSLSHAQSVPLDEHKIVVEGPSSVALNDALLAAGVVPQSSENTTTVSTQTISCMGGYREGGPSHGPFSHCDVQAQISLSVDGKKAADLMGALMNAGAKAAHHVEVSNLSVQSVDCIRRAVEHSAPMGQCTILQ